MLYLLTLDEFDNIMSCYQITSNLNSLLNFVHRAEITVSLIYSEDECSKHYYPLLEPVLTAGKYEAIKKSLKMVRPVVHLKGTVFEAWRS